MSTKGTITAGLHIHDFHLFEELEDTDTIYLRLATGDFIATPRGVSIAIPIDLWEHLRKHTHSILSSRYAHKTDGEIAQIINNEVMTTEYCERIKKLFGKEASFDELLEQAQAERDAVEQIKINTTMLDSAKTKTL